jgi:hypothetical protein
MAPYSLCSALRLTLMGIGGAIWDAVCLCLSLSLIFSLVLCRSFSFSFSRSVCLSVVFTPCQAGELTGCWPVIVTVPFVSATYICDISGCKQKPLQLPRQPLTRGWKVCVYLAPTVPRSKALKYFVLPIHPLNGTHEQCQG